jgi:hypothetical protein
MLHVPPPELPPEDVVPVAAPELDPLEEAPAMAPVLVDETVPTLAPELTPDDATPDVLAEPLVAPGPDVELEDDELPEAEAPDSPEEKKQPVTEQAARAATISRTFTCTCHPVGNRRPSQHQSSASQ